MRILFIGDLMGRSGREAMGSLLPHIKTDRGPLDFVIVNGENAAGGFGLTRKVMDEIFGFGADCITGGNHTWDKKEFLPVLDEEARVLRPANYPPGCPGSGTVVLEKKGKRLRVINLQGRVYMPPLDCPFRKADALLEENDALCVFVDFHAEATSEKRALFHYLDGRVSCVVGTHTHIQTADEEILPGGTAVITDAGMTGGHGGVIGMEVEGTLSRFLNGLPSKFEVCSRNVQLRGLLAEVDDETGRALSVERIAMPLEKA
ncbi:MAG TPA: TIGR00282 family metallophosphoesterase [Synergistaceae bacterium]|nr:TIGR00282 family metallophosphoesterase [Synergistaceae bacterium]HPJ26250.1 TIGR00282 family metallophosphoesterase [Synergistaceae bacterium]HPQ38055.1 TIGR00282 family metallophosphoesterase [Synergistaceae bacterium]